MEARVKGDELKINASVIIQLSGLA